MLKSYIFGKPYTMSNFWLDFINIFCASILALLSFIDNISKRSFAKKSKFLQTSLNFAKRLRVKVTVVILVGIIAFLTNNQKNKNIEYDKRVADTAFQKELDRRDKLSQAQFNESLTKSSSAAAASTAKTMAKYYLKYDSSQHRIESVVRDSSSNKLVKPELAFAEVEGIQKGDTLHLTVVLKSIQGTAYFTKCNIRYVVRLYSFSYDSKYLFVVNSGSQLIRTPLTVDGVPKAIPQRFVNSYFSINKPKVYAYFYGNYQNLKGKVFNFEQIVYFDYSTGRQGDLTDKEYNWIHGYLKTHLNDKDESLPL